MEVERLAIIRQNHMLNHLSATFPKEKKKMASKSIFVSDISGNELTEKDAVRVSISDKAEDAVYVLDASRDEVKELIGKGIKQARRGAKKK